MDLLVEQQQHKSSVCLVHGRRKGNEEGGGTTAPEPYGRAGGWLVVVRLRAVVRSCILLSDASSD